MYNRPVFYREEYERNVKKVGLRGDFEAPLERMLPIIEAPLSDSKNWGKVRGVLDALRAFPLYVEDAVNMMLFGKISAGKYTLKIKKYYSGGDDMWDFESHRVFQPVFLDTRGTERKTCNPRLSVPAGFPNVPPILLEGFHDRANGVSLYGNPIEGEIENFLISNYPDELREFIRKADESYKIRTDEARAFYERLA